MDDFSASLSALGLASASVKRSNSSSRFVRDGNGKTVGGQMGSRMEVPARSGKSLFGCHSIHCERNDNVLSFSATCQAQSPG